MDRNDLTVAERVLRLMPEMQSCIACGACTATCTAAGVTDFNIRRVQTLVRRGEYANAYDELNKCMLCGKCRLVCPRGINTRGMILLLKRELSESASDKR